MSQAQSDASVGMGRKAVDLTATTPQNQESPVLECVGVVKRFRHVEALRGVDFDVRPGEVVGLVGDNGAGKSTLVKILAGVYQHDGGDVRVNGRSVQIASPIDARELGIEVVYQDLGLAPDLSAVENLFVGREIVRGGIAGRVFGFLDRPAMQEAARAAMTRYSLNLVAINEPVCSLSGGQQQRVSIVGAVMDRSKVLLLDEPTAALGVDARRRVLDLIRRVRDQGTSVVVISHDLPDLLEVADRLHIMRLGQRAAVLDRSDADLELVVDIMSGVTR
jgi:simple sugar transport system ATP-binding protein